MPGYAVAPSTDQILVAQPDTIEEIYNKVFYGFKYNPETGKTTVEVIREGEPIKLPESESYLAYEYAHWFASAKAINFTWEDSNKKTRLLMEIV